ncbi:hypothetical protein CFC21_010080 [Triticum aestivum]|uniref:DUF4220 domain-containing protein n=2 Tax=Triticum aestivum TaxID=4565 RepID=A0A9R1DJK8_WHEAT|nr:uncharacterized protein LOC123180031 [Triticum aestivum]KAF6993149.1 hypothetical protein CFC21_010080 [Triticum aestivum]
MAGINSTSPPPPFQVQPPPSAFCDSSSKLLPFVYNLTIFYAEANLRGDEAPLVATSVVMFVLAVLFFILNVFSRSSDVSTILNPTVRLILSTSLSLFLPATSYLFSEAKNAVGQTADLSVRARTILMWMFLVELLRKKVEAILVTAGMHGYSDTIHSASRVVWLGSLVFFNLRSAGKKALYGTLWVLAAAKLVQRFVTVELGKRSFAYGRNPQLLASYMTQMLKLQGQDNHGPAGSDVLKRCNYAVIGEEELKKEAGPKGYKLDELEKAILDTDSSSSVITVGKIWAFAEKDPMLRSDPKLKRLCLSFALFKLLRRRLEEFPITDAEASNCRDLVFKGLWQEGMVGEDAIQVFSDELQFLCEYYHSVLPVVFASPFFFVHNYILFPIIVWAFCILMLISCSNGDVAYALDSFRTDNYVMSGGMLRMARCVLGKVWESLSTPFVFCGVDISITILLILAFAYEEVWEFIVFLLSNWFMVSLLCSHTSTPEWRTHPLLRRIIPSIVSVRNTMNQPKVCFKQFSVLRFSRLSLPLPTREVPEEAKTLIMERLARVSRDAPLSNGMSVLRSAEHRLSIQSHELSWACKSDSIAEVILTWHIATALLDATCRRQRGTRPEDGREAATALSGYCAYLVAFHPKLLPDDKDGTELVHADMKMQLREEMGGWWGYYRSGESERYTKLMQVARTRQEGTTVISKGARLGKVFIDRYKDDARERVWKLLGDLWTEVMLYVAPTSSELHMKAHKEALAEGGEFITVLWAIVTHTGIARPAEPVEAPLRSISISGV